VKEKKKHILSHTNRLVIGQLSLKDSYAPLPCAMRGRDFHAVLFLLRAPSPPSTSNNPKQPGDRTEEGSHPAPLSPGQLYHRNMRSARRPAEASTDQTDAPSGSNTLQDTLQFKHHNTNGLEGDQQRIACIFLGSCTSKFQNAYELM